MNQTIQQAIDNYLQHLKLSNRSPHTIRQYRGNLRDFASLSDALVPSDLDVDHIERYLDGLSQRKLGKASVLRALAAVKSLSRWLFDEGVLNENAAEAFNGPRQSHHVTRRATDAEVRRMIEGPIETSFPERDRLILELMYGSGLRCDETANIRASDFGEPDLLLVSKGKGEKQRYVLLTDYAKEALALYLEKREQILSARAEAGDNREITALFFGLSGMQIDALSSKSVYRIVTAIARNAGVEWLSPHDLRRAFATHMDEHGAQHVVIQRLLGHTKLSVTERYIAAGSPQRLKRAYNAARIRIHAS